MDGFNTKEGGDVSTQNALRAQDALPKKKDEELTTAELYSIGIKIFRDAGIIIKNSFGGPHCSHDVMISSPPIQIKGINYPNWFLPYRPIFTVDDYKCLESVFKTIDNGSVAEFWGPLVFPQVGDSRLNQYAQRLNLMERISSQYKMTDTFEYGHTHDPSSNGVFGKNAHRPISWVPAAEWFDSKIRENLDFDTIFCLFPPAERQIFKLWLGRVAVGRSNHLPPNANQPILHTARMAVVILSREAGIGKSTITNYLYGALNKCGFSVESFKNTGDRFGMNKAAQAHILQKDDVSEDSLLKFLSSEESKILISNGSMRVEEKFMTAETIFPRCAILLNSNSWSSNYAYKLDPGIQSRIKCLSTYSRSELNNQKIRLEGCPDLRPFSLIPWLAETLDTSVDAVMLYATRLAADYFYNTITAETDGTYNPLEEEVYKYTSRLRYRFKNDVLGSFTRALALSSAIMALIRGDEPYLPEFNFRMLYECSKDFYFLSTDPSGLDYCSALRGDWESKGSITSHPYQALRDLRLDSLKQALDWAQETYINTVNSGLTVKMPESEILKQFVSYITMRDGFKLSGSISYFIDAINNISFQSEELFELANQLLPYLKKEAFLYKQIEKFAVGSSSKSSDGWMEDKNYSPRIAEKLRRKARDKILGK